MNDLAFILPFAPPFTARTANGDMFHQDRSFGGMIDLFGGILYVQKTRLLLDACAETPETQPTLWASSFFCRACDFWLATLQSGPPFETSICRGTSRFGHLRPRHSLLIVRWISHRASWLTHSQILHPTGSPRSSPPIKTTASLAYHLPRLDWHGSLT